MGYVFAVQRNCSSLGDGVLIMYKSHLLIDVNDCADYYVTGSCEIVVVNFQGTTVLCVYCQPGDIDLTITES